MIMVTTRGLTKRQTKIVHRYLDGEGKGSHAILVFLDKAEIVKCILKTE